MKKFIFFLIIIFIFFGCDAEKLDLVSPEPEQSGYGRVAFNGLLDAPVSVFNSNGEWVLSTQTLESPDTLQVGDYYAMGSLEGFYPSGSWFSINSDRLTPVDIDFVSNRIDTNFVVQQRDSLVVIYDTTWIKQDPLTIFRDKTSLTAVCGLWLNANYVYHIPKAVTFFSPDSQEVKLFVITNNNSYDEQNQEVLTSEVNGLVPDEAISQYGYGHYWSFDPTPQDNQYIKSFLGTFHVVPGENCIDFFSLRYFNENEPRHSVGIVAVIVEGENLY